MKTTVGGIIIKEKNGEEYVLLTKRSIEPYKGYWCLPGGHIEKGETAEEAIKREIEEETGLIFIGNYFSDFEEIIPEKNINTTVLIYEGYGIGEPKLIEDEVSEIEWFTFTEALKLELAFKHKGILISHLDSKARGKGKDVFLTEFVQLRNEILKHVDNRIKILQFAIILFGGFLGVTEIAKELIDHNLILFYPILATFLAALWTHSDLRIHELATYIRTKLEPKISDLNWEHFLQSIKKRKGQQKKLLERAIIGFFLISEIISILFVLVITTHSIGNLDWINAEFIILVILDLIAIIFTYRLLSLRRRKYN